MRRAKPGVVEQEIVGEIESIARAHGRELAYPVIFSRRGETLHNNHYENRLEPGDLVVNDSGATSPGHYASDITRTLPVSGRFTSEQRELYEIVLRAQEAAIHLVKPGVPYRDVHFAAARVLASGLKDLGFLKGDLDELVTEGAHAVAFPHGTGHMIGLDVHDMEALGEDRVGYGDGFERSTQFGLNHLRLAKKLEPGNVVTIEPGLYIIPALNGARVLGKPIPKSVRDVEAVAQS
jgi:Xaa-Pro aminopeptidase/Xaa-Pro dipeptidase